MRIVLNGCFDLFHDGHKHIINKGLTWADTLLILINSDESVQKLKGENRPINNLIERTESIKNYYLARCKELNKYPVIHIVEFTTEDELESLINNFEPDLILKGNDRPDVREIVGSVNWPVCILPRIKNKNKQDISTTLIIGDEIG